MLTGATCASWRSPPLTRRLALVKAGKVVLMEDGSLDSVVSGAEELFVVAL